MCRAALENVFQSIWLKTLISKSKYNILIYPKYLDKGNDLLCRFLQYKENHCMLQRALILHLIIA